MTEQDSLFTLSPTDGWRNGQVARGYISYECMPVETPGMDTGAPVARQTANVGDLKARNARNYWDDFCFKI